MLHVIFFYEIRQTIGPSWTLQSFLLSKGRMFHYCALSKG